MIEVAKSGMLASACHCTNSFIILPYKGLVVIKLKFFQISKWTPLKMLKNIALSTNVYSILYFIVSASIVA